MAKTLNVKTKERLNVHVRWMIRRDSVGLFEGYLIKWGPNA